MHLKPSKKKKKKSRISECNANYSVDGAGHYSNFGFHVLINKQQKLVPLSYDAANRFMLANGGPLRSE